MSSSTPTDQPQARLGWQLGAIVLARAVVNTAYRLVYPFLPAIARGLGLDLATVSLAVAARSGVVVAGPLLGSLADIRGRRTAVGLAMGLFIGGMVLLSVWPTFAGLLVGLLMAASGKLLLDPTTHAFLGDRVPYRRRGLVMGLTEAAWALAFLVGMPLVGWSIARGGWSAPFPWLAGLGALFGLALWWLLPSARVPAGPRPRLLQVLRDTLGHRTALAGLAVGFLISMAAQVISIVYGAWLEQAFGLQVTALGATAIAIGLAELGGEGLVAGLADRLGKRRAIAIGVGVNLLVVLVLPLAEGSLALAMVVLFLFYLSFEFALVSVLTLATELTPSSRATLMSSSVASMEFSHAFGTILGPRLFAFGLLANSVCTAVLNLAALVVLLAFLPRDEATRTRLEQ